VSDSGDLLVLLSVCWLLRMCGWLVLSGRRSSVRLSCEYLQYADIVDVLFAVSGMSRGEDFVIWRDEMLV
jgi:hypothetical protein